MDKLDENINDALAANGHYDADKGREMKRQAADRFCSSLRQVERLTLGFIILLVGLALFSMFQFMRTDSTRLMILFAIVFLVAMEGQTLIKLWYWVANTKISIMRELTQIRLEFRKTAADLRSGDSAPEQDPVPADLIRGPNVLRVPERLAWYALLIVVIAVGLHGVIGACGTRFGGGRQEDEWRITSSADVMVESRLKLNPQGDRPAQVTMVLPYPEGTVQSVTVEGQRVQFETRRGGEFAVTLLVRDGRPCGDNVVVNWAVPLDLLAAGDGTYRAELRGLLPVTHLSLTVVLDPDCGYEFERHPSRERLRVFSRGGGRPVLNAGSCGLCIRRQQP